jgi:hypothetical protein
MRYELTIPTWLVFLFLGIASFAPMVSVQPRWWVPYYGALLLCWVLVSVAVIRRVARENRKAERSLSRRRRPLRDVKNAEPAATSAAQARDPLDAERGLSRVGLQLRDAKNAEPAETGAAQARDPLDAEPRLSRVAPQLGDAKNAEPAETSALPARDPLHAGRLIIVARDQAGLYDYIRRRHSGNQTVSVITDRRRADRRHEIEAHVPDRRRGERRRHDIEGVLRAQGWAQVIFPES